MFQLIVFINELFYLFTASVRMASTLCVCVCVSIATLAVGYHVKITTVYVCVLLFPHRIPAGKRRQFEGSSDSRE